MSIKPGPYLTRKKTGAVYLGGPLDHKGRIPITDANRDVWYRKPSSLTPADRWPGWWPWPDMPLPESPLHVGDFAVARNGSSYPSMIIGMYGGTVQRVDRRGTATSGCPIEELQRIDRPDDWYNYVTETDCGTVMCIAGWSTHLTGHEHAPLESGDVIGETVHGQRIFDIARKNFGLSLRDARELFTGDAIARGTMTPNGPDGKCWRNWGKRRA